MRMNLSTEHVKYFDNGSLKVYNALYDRDYEVDIWTTFSYKVGVNCIFWFNI